MLAPLSCATGQPILLIGIYLLAATSLFCFLSGGADGFVRLPFALPLLLCTYLSLGAGAISTRVAFFVLGAVCLATACASHPHNYSPWSGLGPELATSLAGGLLVAGALSCWRFLGAISRTGRPQRVTLADLLWIVSLACVAAAAWSYSDVPPLAVGYFWDRVLGSALLGSAAVLLSFGPKRLWQFVGASCALAVFPRHGWVGSDAYVSLLVTGFQLVNLLWTMLPLVILRCWGYRLR